MKLWPDYENLHTLCEKHVFSSEELDLLMQRINEELEYASSDILRTWKKESGYIQHTDL
jgi:hypothetical protein